MILKASSRGSGSKLAAHLLNANDNDHITVHEVSGFMADDVHGAFREVEGISKGTKCTQYLFSLSLSPPAIADVTPAEYEDVISRVEDKLGLKAQPRVIVFHEKENRMHAHAVWSRIDADQMKAINLPFFKRRLNEISRDVYLEKGWDLPAGFLNHEKRDPLNYSLAEYAQAKRMDQNPRLLKAALKECWSRSDSKDQFQAELKRHGFFLARGDRRGYMAVNMTGKPLSLSRWLDVKTKELKAKLGDNDKLPSMSEVSTTIKSTADKHAPKFEADIKTSFQKRITPLLAKRKTIIQEQSKAREALRVKQDKRDYEERLERQNRFRTGLKGIWDRLNGKHKVTVRQNKLDFLKSKKRDQLERHDLRMEQLKERRHIVYRIRETRNDFGKQKARLSAMFEHKEIPTKKPTRQSAKVRAPTLGRSR